MARDPNLEWGPKVPKSSDILFASGDLYSCVFLFCLRCRRGLFIYKTKVLWGLKIMLQIGKVLGTHSSLSFPSELICLFCIGQRASFCLVFYHFPKNILLKIQLFGGIRWTEWKPCIPLWFDVFGFVKVWYSWQTSL